MILKSKVVVEITYRGTPISDLEDELFAYAKKLKGKEVGSGYFFMKDVRDLSFAFSRADDAGDFIRMLPELSAPFKPQTLRCPKCKKTAFGFFVKGKKRFFIHKKNFTFKRGEKMKMKGCLV